MSWTEGNTALRQLSNRKVQGRRRKAACLPGGRLKPLARNHGVVSPTESTSSGEYPNNTKVLPDINSNDHAEESVGSGDTGTSPKGDIQDGITTVLKPSQNAISSGGTTDFVQEMLRGSLDNLPPLPSNEVRIYLCSTFSDFIEERKILLRLAYPELREYCSEKGMDFRVIDIRLGVTDDTLADPMLTELCLEEIKRCQKNSSGPNFVALIGDRCSYRPLPQCIPSDEFGKLHHIVSSQNQENANLLEIWYKRNENTEPGEFVLNLPDMDASDENTVSAEMTKVLDILKDAADVAFANKEITMMNRNRYFRSVLENEIIQGILTPQDRFEHSLCYIREFKNISVEHKEAERYTDIKKVGDVNQLDDDSNSTLFNLKTKFLPKKLQGKNLRKYEIEWHEDGLQPGFHEEQKQYITQFCQDFVQDIKGLIDKQIQAVEKDYGHFTPLIKEVLYHAHFARQRCTGFCGRNELFESIRTSLKDAKNSSLPLILHGDAGYGKTSVMATMIPRLKSWFGPDVVMVYRFLGTSFAGCQTHLLMYSLYSQICAIYGLQNKAENSSLSRLLNEFEEMLELVSKDHLTVDKPLVIMLDSIDQLAPLNETVQALMVLKTLPPNVFLILSTLPHVGDIDILELAKEHYHKDTVYVNIGQLSESEANEILDTALKLKSRKITQEQRNKILEAHRETGQALHLKLLLDHGALKWTSFEEDIHVAESTEAAIENFYQKLESKHGIVMVSSALSYLTIAGHGVTESEFETLLSSNEKVLKEVYNQKHVQPPFTGVVMIPTMILTALIHDLQDCLIQKPMHGRTVMTWCHTQFLDVACERYKLMYPGIRNEMITEEASINTVRHQQDFVDMYLAEDWTDAKEFTLTEKGIDRAHILVTPQTLRPANLRKLHCLPYHLKLLMLIDGPAAIKRECLCNFNWLLTKLKGTSLKDVLDDYTTTIELLSKLHNQNLLPASDDLEVFRMIMESLKVAEKALIHNPENLAAEIIGRTVPEALEYPWIVHLLSQAKQWAEKSETPVIIPVCACLAQPAKTLVFEESDVNYIVDVITHTVDDEDIDSDEYSDDEMALPESVKFQNWKQENVTAGSEHNEEENKEEEDPPRHYVTDRIVTYSVCNGVQIRDVGTCDVIHKMSAPEFSVETLKSKRPVKLSHDGELLYILKDQEPGSSVKSVITVWDTSTGEKFAAKEFEQKVLIFQPLIFGKFAVVYEDGNSIDLISCAKHIQSAVSGTPVSNINAMAFDHQTECLIAVGNSTIQIGKLHFEHQTSDENSDEGQSVERLTFGEPIKLDLPEGPDRTWLTKLNVEHSLLLCADVKEGNIIVFNSKLAAVMATIESKTYKNMVDFLMTKNGKFVLIATWNLGVDIWSIKPCKCVKTIDYPEPGQDGSDEEAIEYTPSALTMDNKELFLAVGFQHGEIAVYFLPTCKLVKIVTHGTAAISNLVFLENKNLVSTSDDGMLKQWNLTQVCSDVLASFKSDDSGKTKKFTESFDPNKVLLEDNNEERTSSRNSESSVMDTKDDRVYPLGDEDVKSISVLVSTDGSVYKGSKSTLAVTVSEDKDQPIRIWEMESGVCMQSFAHGFEKSVCAANLLYTSGHLLCLVSGKDSSLEIYNLKVWDFTKGKAEQIQAMGGNLECTCSKISQSGKKIALVQIHWDESDNKRCKGFSFKMTLNDAGMTSTDVSFSEDIVSGYQEISVIGFSNNDSTVVVGVKCKDTTWFYSFMLDSEEVTLTKSSPFQTGKSLHLTLTDNRMAAAQSGIVIWDVVEQTVICELSDEVDEIGCMTAHDVKSLLIVTTNNVHENSIHIWDTVEYNKLHTLSTQQNKVTCLEVFEHGDFIMIGLNNNTIAMLDIVSGNKVAEFYTHSIPQQIVLSPKSSEDYFIAASVGETDRRLLFLEIEGTVSASDKKEVLNGQFGSSVS